MNLRSCRRSLGTAINGPVPTVAENTTKIVRAHFRNLSWRNRYGRWNGCFAIKSTNDDVVVWTQIDENYNQIFYSWYRFCHWWCFIKSNILPERENSMLYICYRSKLISNRSSTRGGPYRGGRHVMERLYL
jgi:hypothetical protein